MSGRVLRLLRVGITVADLPRVQAFYQEALGFASAGAAVEADPAWARLLGADGARVRMARLRLGAQEIELAGFEPPGQPYPPGSTAADLWFQHIAVVTDDMTTAYDRVRRHGGATPITEGEPQRLPPEAGGVTAYKFRDPEGHPVELIHFPPGAGAWQHATPGAMTLGYDHSAISVADADRSVAFYAGLLGLAQASGQVNSGPAQERLDGLPGDVVDVVALRPAAAPTPHIELLAYRTPRGRPAPDLRSRDVAAERLVMQVVDLPGLLAALAAGGFATAEPGVVPLADGSRAALIHDPDRHTLVLVEEAARA